MLIARLRALPSTILAIADRHSWAFGVFGVALAAIGGVITNATVGFYLKDACGAEGKACFHGAVAFLFTTYEGLMVTFGGLFTSISIMVSYSDKLKIDRLETDNQQKSDEIFALQSLNLTNTETLDKRSIDTFQVFSLYLKHTASELRLGVEDRISIYKVSEEYFFLFGRFSKNHSYTKIGRRYYQREQGVIEDAFEKNWAQSEMQCSYEKNVARKRKYADEHLRRFRIPSQVSNNFNMKSRSYRALAVKGEGLGRPVAIVCVESTVRGNLNHITREVLVARLPMLASLLEALEHHIPSMDNAMSEGL